MNVFDKNEPTNTTFHFRVEFENAKLRKQNRKDGDKIVKLNRDLQDIQVANETLKREIDLLRRTISQIEVERSSSAANTTETNTQMNAANHSQCFREIKQLVSGGFFCLAKEG